MAEPGMADEQPIDGPETATEDTGLESAEGQSVEADQTTNDGPDELIYDPEAIRGKPELEALAKQLQGDYTRKMQSVAEQRRKIEAYDAFEANPMDTIRSLAQQYGYQLTQGQIEQRQQEQAEPQSWEEVFSEAEKRAEQKLMQKFAPLINKVENLQQNNIQTYLDNKYPDWRTYEDGMTNLVKKHPTLANDPDTLYEMAVPAKVRQARATKAALAKLQADSGAAQVSGGSQTTKQVSDKPKGPLSFQEAVEFAKRKMASGR